MALAEYSRIKFTRLILVTLQAFCREKVRPTKCIQSLRVNVIDGQSDKLSFCRSLVLAYGHWRKSIVGSVLARHVL